MASLEKGFVIKNTTCLLLMIMAMSIAILSCGTQEDESGSAEVVQDEFPVPQTEYAPEHYLCFRTPRSLNIDGRLNERVWRMAAMTEPFVDIEGDLRPEPRLETRVRLLYDDHYLYVSALMREPHVWGTLIKRDTIIYQDNDFELFIDPDGDTHEYYELEINALGTVWDLFLTRPYRDGGPVNHDWDIMGLKAAVAVFGTVNNPHDVDSGWSAEIAIPWNVLTRAHRSLPPKDGDVWWMNFSRVQWQTEVVDGKYVKLTDEDTGEALAEDNWVWSPQGLVNMHYPERWGLVQFVDTVVRGRDEVFTAPDDLAAREAMRQLYYAQRQYELEQGSYATDLDLLELDELLAPGYVWPPTLNMKPGSFVATMTSEDGTETMSINSKGRLQVIAPKGK